MRKWHAGLLKICAVIIAVLPAAGSSRPSGLPKGFEEVNFAHFKNSLSKLWGQLTRRDPGELAAKIALALSAQQLSRSVVGCDMQWLFVCVRAPLHRCIE
jgi:hypothetical protein